MADETTKVQHRAKLEDDGSVIGFYPSDIYPNAPDGSIEISTEVYRGYLDGQAAGKRFRIVDGALVENT